MKSGQRAFTLIELLTVLLIVAILAALIIGMSGYAKRMALVKRAAAQVEQIHFAIQEHQIRNGRLPVSLGTLTIPLPEGFVYSSNLPVDPWGMVYQYTVSGESYRLFSMGPDKGTGSSTNSADDIESGK